MSRALQWLRIGLDRVTIYLPIILTAALAMGTYWLVRNAPKLMESRAPAVITHDPDYFMRGFVVKRFFADRAGVEWEELSFSVNGTRWGPDRPAFPLLQAEKVLSPPLDLRLDADYRYRLDGTDTVDGASCYVVRFTPNAASTAKSLYRGTVWIDRETFRRRKLQAVQTGLDAPVVSNRAMVPLVPVQNRLVPAIASAIAPTAPRSDCVPPAKS